MPRKAARLIVLLMNRTEPSPNRALTPPEWKLNGSSFGAGLVARRSRWCEGQLVALVGRLARVVGLARGPEGVARVGPSPEPVRPVGTPAPGPGAGSAVGRDGRL